MLDKAPEEITVTLTAGEVALISYVMMSSSHILTLNHARTSLGLSVKIAKASGLDVDDILNELHSTDLGSEAEEWPTIIKEETIS